MDAGIARAALIAASLAIATTGYAVDPLADDEPLVTDEAAIDLAAPEAEFGVVTNPLDASDGFFADDGRVVDDVAPIIEPAPEGALDPATPDEAEPAAFIPEPAGVALLGGAMLVMIGLRRCWG